MVISAARVAPAHRPSGHPSRVSTYRRRQFLGHTRNRPSTNPVEIGGLFHPPARDFGEAGEGHDEAVLSPWPESPAPRGGFMQVVGLRSGISPLSAKSGEDIPIGHRRFASQGRLQTIGAGMTGRTRGTPTNCPSDRANRRQFRDRRLTFVDRIKIALGLPPHRHIPRIRAPTSMRTLIVAAARW